MMTTFLLKWWGRLFFIIVGLTIALPVRAQTVRIGGQAPLIEPYEWIKGGPIDEYDNEKVYVIEMGATWCKPCTAAIPELTELAQEYEGVVEVIGIFVQEFNSEPLDVPNPKYIERVKSFVEKQGDRMRYTVAVDDPRKNIETNWIDRSGKGRGLPQTFIIDRSGKIAGHFTGARIKELHKVIGQVLDESYSTSTNLATFARSSKGLKIEYDHKKHLFVGNNGGSGDDFAFRSILSKYKGNVKAGRPEAYVRSYHSLNLDSSLFKDYFELQGRVQTVGSPIEHLYYLAHGDTLWYKAEARHPATLEYPDYDTLYWFKRSYGKYWHEPILEVSDLKPFKWSWDLSENRWNYVLNVPDKKKATAAYLQDLMRQDLQRFFGFDVSVEERLMPCWYLKAYPQANELRTKTPKMNYRVEVSENESNKLGTLVRYHYRNADVRDIIGKLASEFNISYSYSSRNTEEAPFIDMTGIDYLIDYDMTSEENEYFNQHDIVKVQKYLNRLGLYLERGKKQMKVIVIRDPKT